MDSIILCNNNSYDNLSGKSSGSGSNLPGNSPPPSNKDIVAPGVTTDSEELGYYLGNEFRKGKRTLFDAKIALNYNAGKGFNSSYYNEYLSKIARAVRFDKTNSIIPTGLNTEVQITTEMCKKLIELNKNYPNK